MSDPLDPLKGSGGGPVHTPLPAMEVRRRGDRMRRRRAGARVVGAAIAVAVVATGGIALGTGRPDAAPQPPAATQDSSPAPGPTSPATPQPEPTPPSEAPVTDTIPAGFPIAEGYPDVAPGSDEQMLVGPGPEVRAFGDVGACGRQLHPLGDPADRLAVLFQQPEDYRARELTTYPSSEAAREVLSTLVTGYRDCPRESHGGTPESTTLKEVRRTDLGDEGFVVVQTYEYDGSPAIGLGQLYVVRAGNAVLLSSTSNEGGADPQAVDAAVRSESDALTPVVDAMCAFSESGC